MEITGNQIYSNVEFDVNLFSKSCAAVVLNSLSYIRGIKMIDISVLNQTVIVKTYQPSTIIKEAIEKTGKRAVLKGFGANTLGSAVAELKNKPILGVIRFHQMTEELCIIDGTIDGLSPGEHGLHIHEFGDLSEVPISLGSHFNPADSVHGGPEDNERHYGDMGNILANAEGRASFKVEDKVIKVHDIIGRSIAVSSNKDDLGRGENDLSKVDGNSGPGLAFAIIARSAGIFENPKRICHCDGTTVWDEIGDPVSL